MTVDMQEVYRHVIAMSKEGGRVEWWALRLAEALEIDHRFSANALQRITETYYFGTYLSSGHYLWNTAFTKLWHSRNESPVPWGWALDGTLAPKREVEGEALLHYKDGWTALSFANRTDDSRSGSNATFFFNTILTFEQAVEAAKLHWPRVVNKFDFEIVPAKEVTRL